MTDPVPANQPRLGLRRSVLIALVTGVALWVAASFAIGRSILVASMLQHEQEDGLSLASRMQGLVETELARLDRTSRDWSAWDETWSFARGEGPDYVERNVYDSVFANLKLTLMAFVGADDTVRLVRAAEPGTGEARPVPPEFARLIAPGGAWLEAHQRDRPFSGIVPSEAGPLAFVAHPIHRSTPEAPGASAGTQVFGRLLGQDFIDESRPLLQAELALFDVRDAALPRDVGQAITDIGAGDAQARPLDVDRLAAYALLRDLWGQPVAVLRAISPRSVYADARRAERWLLLASLAIGLLAGSGLYVLMSRRVLRPLQFLDEAVNELARDGGAARVPPGTADDEFARLGRSINGLLDELDTQRDAREARDAAQAASRLKGELLARIADRTQEPLAALRAALDELLTADTLGADGRGALERAWRAAHGVGSALSGMPDFTWADNSTRPIVRQAVDVRAVIEDAACLAAARGTQADTRVVCRIDPDLVATYLGDGLRLRALLHALLSDWPTTPAAAGRRLMLDTRLCERGKDSDGLAIECSGLYAAPVEDDSAGSPVGGGEHLLATELGGLLTATPDGWRLVLHWPRAAAATGSGPATRPLAGCRALLVGTADTERDVLEAYLRALGSAVTCCVALTPAATHEVDVAVCIVEAAGPLPRLGDLPFVVAWPAGVPPAPRAAQRIDLQRPVRWDEFRLALTQLLGQVTSDS